MVGIKWLIIDKEMDQIPEIRYPAQLGIESQ